MEVQPGHPAPVVVKQATGPNAAALRAEGERLRAAAHPGVVEVLESTGTDDAWELRLAHAGRPLAAAGALTTAQVAGLAAAVASTLADLHEGGIVHGRVDAGHVLISRQGRPVLCGFGASTDAEQADDVAAVGALLTELLGPTADMEPMPERRWPRRAWSGWDRRTLLLLADQACAEPPSRRPPARRLATAITEAVPGALLGPPAGEPATPTNDDPIEALRASAAETSAPGRSRLPLLAGAAAVVLLVAVGSVRTLRPDTSPATVMDAAPSNATVLATSDLPPTTTTTRPGPAPAPCVVLPGTSPGACAPVRVVGTAVRVGKVHFELGEPGDELVLGDWDCDGSATPALLRPTTGDVFVFPSWAVDRDLVVRPAARVQGAQQLDVVASGAGTCAGLVARTASGPVPVETRTTT